MKGDSMKDTNIFLLSVVVCGVVHRSFTAVQYLHLFDIIHHQMPKAQHCKDLGVSIIRKTLGRTKANVAVLLQFPQHYCIATEWLSFLKSCVFILAPPETRSCKWCILLHYPQLFCIIHCHHWYSTLRQDCHVAPRNTVCKFT